MKQRLSILLITLGIFLLAAIFRLYGVNWDQNQHLHPDERFLTMVAGEISWPKDLIEYLDTSISSLNPHNRGFSFFVYGTFPIFLTKWVAEIVGQGDYNGLTIVGRQLSALFDLGTVILVFLIGKQINTNKPINKSSNQLIKKGKIGLLDNWVIGNWIIPLTGMFLYSIMVLPIQLSHFFAVDTYLTFFTILSFYLGIKLFLSANSINNEENKILNIKYKIYKLKIKNLIYIFLLGISFGLALSSKISAIYFLPIILIIILFTSIYSVRNLKNNKILNFFYVFFIFSFLFLISMYLTVRLAQPYLFATPDIFNISLNPKVLNNWKQLESFNDKTGGFPPAVQWITTIPYIFPLKNMLIWGLGLPLGIISMVAVSYYVLRIIYYVYKRKLFSIFNSQSIILNLSLLFTLIIFIYQGRQFVKALRYFYPIYPFLAIISGYFLYQIFNIKNQIYISKIKKSKFLNFLYMFFIFSFLFFILIPGIAFISIYTKPNSRIQASYWIYKNIPAGSTLSSEEWDDGLPMSLDNNIREKYRNVQFPLYWPDTKEKWDKIANSLIKTDYVILSSNRLYGSIMTYPQKYPLTIKFYNSLFDGTLGFTKLAEFTSRPNIPFPSLKLCLTPPYVRYGIVALKTQECSLPGISFVDDYADETFTVYDHPKVIIFKKMKEVDYLQVLGH